MRISDWSSDVCSSDLVDEFAHLRHDINHMLDRIETLMNGVRNVSDSIAHNIRTPLARVLAKLHKAQNGTRDVAGLSAAIDSASDEIMDLISVAEKLLLIAEAESGVRRQTFRPVLRSEEHTSELQSLIRI